MGDLADAKNEQARALELDRQARDRRPAAQQGDVGLLVEAKKGGANTEWTEYHMVTLDEKRCYAGLSLAATCFSRAVTKRRKETAAAAKCPRFVRARQGSARDRSHRLCRDCSAELGRTEQCI